MKNRINIIERIMLFICIISLSYSIQAQQSLKKNNNFSISNTESSKNNIETLSSEEKINYFKKCFNSWAVYNPELDIIEFKNRKTFLYLEALLDANESSLPAESTGVVERDGIFQVFETNFKNFQSLNKRFFELENEYEENGIKEPETGYEFEEGFIDDVQNAYLNSIKAYKIGPTFYRFEDVNTLYATNDFELGKQLVTCLYEQLIELKDNKSVLIHHLGRGTVEIKGQEKLFKSSFKRSSDFDKKLSAIKSGIIQLEIDENMEFLDDDDCEVIIDNTSLTGCNQLCFDALAYVNGLPAPLSLQYEWYVLDENLNIVAQSGLTSNLSWCATISGSGTFVVRFQMKSGPCIQTESDIVVDESEFDFTQVMADFNYEIEKCKPNNISFKSNAIFNINFGDGFKTCKWTYKLNGGSPVSFGAGIQNPSISLPSFGTYEICYEVTSLKGCVSQPKCSTIVISDKCDAIFEYKFITELCTQEQCKDKVQIKFLWNKGVACPGWKYEWKFEGVNYFATANGAEVIHTFPGCGTYTATLNVTSSTNCKHEETMQVDIFPPKWDFDYMVCPNGRVVFTAKNLPVGSCNPLKPVGKLTWKVGGNDLPYILSNLIKKCQHAANFESGTHLVKMIYTDIHDRTCEIVKTITVVKECCLQNAKTKKVKDFGSIKVKGKFVARNNLLMHSLFSKTKTSQKCDLVVAGAEGTYHEANGNWFEIVVLKNSCNCVSPIYKSYDDDDATNFNKVKYEVPTGNGYFAIKENHMTSTHKVEDKGQPFMFNLLLTNSNDCNNSSKVESPTISSRNSSLSKGKRKIVISEQIIASPNPSSNSTFISVHLLQKSQVQFDIYDLNGKLIFQYDSKAQLPQGVNTIELNMDSWNSGVYFLKTNLNNSKHQLKLVKI